MEHGLPQASFDIHGLFLMVRRHLWTLAFGGMLGVILVFALHLAIQPQYTATATLIVDSREAKIFNDEVVAPFRPSSIAIASEAAVIVAPNVLKRVIDKLELAKDPDFEVRPQTLGMSGFVKAQFFMLFGMHSRDGSRGDGKNDETIAIIEGLRQSIEVIPSQNTNLLQISVSSREPHKAARIANAVVDAYLHEQLEGRFGATRRATEWLKEQLDGHKVKLRQSEDRYEQFKAEMDLVERGPTLEEKQLARLNEELVQQSARTADARAKYESVVGLADGSLLDNKHLAEIAQSTLITQLRTQLAQVTRDEDSLNARFGRGHPAVIKVRAEKQGLTREIAEEVRRIVAVTKSEYEIAASREAALQGILATGTRKTSNQRAEYVRLRELQREAESDKALYEAMLQRMKQAAAQETWKPADFRVVAEALPPLAPSKPKSKVLVLAGLGLGFGLGIGLSLVRELLDKTCKRGQDVEGKLGIPHLVDIPLMPARELGAGDPTRSSDQSALRFAAQHVGSPFADAMLGLLSRLHSMSREEPIKTVMFTSASPGEGKSVVAANFAQVAAQSGFKVLLVCTDLRTPTVGWLGESNAPKADLVDYLHGQADIETLIARGDQATIDVIPATRSAANAASLLASPRMQKLLEWAKANYDLVVIDTVAIVTCLDGRMLARHIDATVVVVEWLKTRVDMAKEAVDLLVKNDARIAGAVLNKVDFTKARLYGLNTSA